MSVTPSQWRQFNFFELEHVDNLDQDSGARNETVKNLTLPYTITSPHPTSPLVSSVAGILCDATGQIVVLDKQFKEQRRWLGWDTQATTELAKEETAGYNLGLVPGSKARKINHEKGLILIECGGLLIGIGEDDSPSQSQFPLLRIWDLRVDRDKSAPPTLLRNVRIGTGGRGYPVSTLALTPNLSYLAIGLVSGQVLLYRHLLQSLSSAPSALSNFPKARVIWEGTAAEPITGLGFRLQNLDRTVTKGGELDHERNGELGSKLAGAGSVGLFIVTTHKTITVPTISGKGSEPRVLEETGASLHCSVMDLEQHFLIVGREDGIYTYDTEGRGSCFAYEGSKAAIRTHGHSIIVISPPFTPTPASHSATVRRSAISTAASSRGEAVKVTVFDLENKLVSYSSIFQDGVRDIFGEDDRQFCISDGRREIWKLIEAPVEEKLEALIRKSLFQLAASMAKMADLDETVLADIHLRYGDHLYEKGDMDKSVMQYVKTLGWVQPSYIIRKYLEAHRIQHLTVYLQELHGQNLATPDHTTLLLNCYAKTLDKGRLDAFVKSETSRKESDALPFDLDTAIRVCRQAGFHEHAVYLAKRYERHSDYLRIQLEDRDNFDAVLVYLRSMPQEMVAELVSPHVKHLLRQHPAATTDLLIAICTEWDVDHPADQSSTALSDGFRLPSAAFGNNSRSDPRTAQKPETLDRTSPAVSKPNPQRYFSDYINHASEFIRFLETVAWKRWNQRVESRLPRSHSQLLDKPLTLDHHKRLEDNEHIQQQVVWNTLLELYLDSDQFSKETEQSDGRQKALSLLDTIALLPLDPVHAMMLCSHFNFEAGLMSLWQRYGMYEEIARYWKQRMGESANATTQLDGRTPAENLLHYLHMYGPVRPELYPLVLRYVTSSPLILSRHGEEIRDILNTIDCDRIMPPLAVLQLLSRNEVTSVGVIKTWLRTQIEGTAQNLDSDKQLVQSYRTETEEKLREIASLNDTTQPQVFQVTRCASCGGQLNLPSVHFMCKHGYHQRCLPDSDPECPACARQHALIKEMRRNQATTIKQHGAFLAEVHESTSGFDVVAGAFSRGLLNVKATEVDL